MRVMMNNLVTKLKNSACAIVLLFCILITTSSCQLLMAIPMMILQIPLIIIGMVFKMLPYLIKLAPLALLFIEGDNEHAVEYYALLPTTGVPIVVNKNVTCYLVDLSDKENALALAYQAADKGDRMVFLQEQSIMGSPGYISEIYENMKRNNIQFAYDARVVDENVEQHDVYAV